MASTTPAPAPEATQPKILISAEKLHTFTKRLLQSAPYSVSEEHAEIVAHALVLADLRGVESHGTLRLPSYLERVRRGLLNANAEPIVKMKTPVVAEVDGMNGWGFVAAQRGMKACIDAAKIYGIGMASVKHSNHFGMSAWIVQQGLDEGMLSLVFTNSSPALPVWGGREKLMGVSPIACGAPGPTPSQNFILDMAPSIAARGKIHKALRRNEPIPSSWALDSSGAPTTDPASALEGVMLPMGGPKGSALAVMMDVFSGVLSGSAFAGGVKGPYDFSDTKEGKGPNVGHFFVALRGDLFLEGGEEEFRERMGVLYGKVVGCERMQGVDRIWFPGEIENECASRRREEGIPFVVGEVESLNAEAERVGSGRVEVMG